MSRLTIINLETLCWIARLGSFSAAANHLNTTQPAISKRVRELEDAVGVRLFQRQGRRMELTVEGRELVARAQPVLDALDDIVVFPEHPSAARGTIRMGVGELVAATWFGKLMAKLRQVMPGVNYQVQVGLTVDMRHRLETGLLDVAILAAPVDSPQLVGTPIGGVDLLWLTGGPAPAAARGRRPGPRELLESSAIWCVAPPSQMHMYLAETLRQWEVQPRKMNTSDSVRSLVEAVSRGAGVGLLPDCMVREQMRAGQLRLLSPQLPPQHMEFVVARRREQGQLIIEQIVKATREVSEFPSARKSQRQ